MRNAFANEITQLALTDKRVILLLGDIGNKLFDKFKEAAPQRFFNCGVAEANMIGMAAGLAMSGFRPIAYTIAPFITYRCLEQIRLDLCYHNVPVVIIGVGAGLGYASLGGTHHSCEDIAMLRTLPHMSVVCPGDPHEVRGAIREALRSSGPCYIRLGKKGEPLVHPQEPNFKIGQAITLQQGSDVCILSTGTMLPKAMQCAELLKDENISPCVVSFHTIKPLDEKKLVDVFSRFTLVVTLEEHSELGGLGGSVAEWACANHFGKARLLTIGSKDNFLHKAGDHEYASGFFGLTVPAIIDRIKSNLSRDFIFRHENVSCNIG